VARERGDIDWDARERECRWQRSAVVSIMHVEKEFGALPRCSRSRSVERDRSSSLREMGELVERGVKEEEEGATPAAKGGRAESGRRA
jgi:hypothetical protein